MAIRPVVLCILDGWGCAEPSPHNAPYLAKTPNLDALTPVSPMSKLATSGLAVGLPEGQMGNSEVGHMNIGCGRVMMQDLPRVDKAVEDGTLKNHPALVKLADDLRASGKACHLMGLFSPGGVHAHMDHIIALAEYLDEAGVNTWLHLVTDGRDTPPESALDYWQQGMLRLANLKHLRIATLMGRYYAMDRDKRWDRVAKAYNAIVSGQGEPAAELPAAIQASYDAGKQDEFILPVIFGGYDGMQDGDAWLFANFRADRARQLSHALLDPAFDGFPRGKQVKFSHSLAMTEYSSKLAPFYSVLFPAETPNDSLGEIVSHAGLKQLRIAETEKYPHVTFFFNGGREELFEGEDRILVPSPQVATYDLQPEMSAPEVTDKLTAAIESGQYALLVVNYANPDMVGHTGNLPAAIKAVEAVDACIGRIAESVEKAGGVMLITADHGNVEKMHDHDTGQAHTAHTTGPVPLMLVGSKGQGLKLKDGALADIAPTILKLMGLSQPKVMTGSSLLV
ncbi:2,3-bisphosphoglycerate-independent phosphoglycerate mutase [bacterium]|nr:2,3-bisphosphoglycerate-independent phosphoglycerate mutase [bacterium]